MTRSYRRGDIATYRSYQFTFLKKGNLYKLIDSNNNYDELKQISFHKYNKNVSYLEVEKDLIKDAFHVTTYVKYKGFVFFLENYTNGLYILRPLEEAEKKLNDYARHGYDPRYDVEEDEVEEIWEERIPIEGFKFDVEPTRYIKKGGIYLGE